MTDSDRLRLDAFAALTARARRTLPRGLASLFADEPDRLARFSLDACGLYLDLSRQAIASDDLDALLALAQALDLPARRDAQLRGEHVNTTESRAVLHTALRRDPAEPLMTEGRDLMPEVAAVLSRMRSFADAVREGRWTGHDGARIEAVVAIGIGGSHLGPQLACEALSPGARPGPRIHFLSNVDPDAWERLQPTLDPARTLCVVASKSWRTDETARNAQTVRRWLRTGGVPEAALGRHLIGVTSHPARARAFGLRDDGIFPLADWVGGRFSLWSAIGLPVLLGAGSEAFDALLAGARAMDHHFASAPLARNAPVLLALTSLWNRLARPESTEVVVPYSDALRLLPVYLQQLQMESTGKSVTMDGAPVGWQTAPVIWGAPGTDAQHSFFQALHQGTVVHPVEFVLSIPAKPDPEGRDIALLASAVAQAEALMHGRSLAQSREAFLSEGLDPARAARLAPHRVQPGDRPSTTLLIGRLTPASLGALIALYEHKVAVLGWLWGINAYDQWGVELGKQLADRAQALMLRAADAPAPGDPATGALVGRIVGALAARDGSSHA